jgi:hypothetical protein
VIGHLCHALVTIDQAQAFQLHPDFRYGEGVVARSDPLIHGRDRMLVDLGGYCRKKS